MEKVSKRLQECESLTKMRRCGRVPWQQWMIGNIDLATLVKGERVYKGQQDIDHNEYKKRRENFAKEIDIVIADVVL